jgi:hypothetical protein
MAQVFSTQSAPGSVAALAPTFLAGLLLEALPVETVLLVVGLLLLSLAPLLFARIAGAAQPSVIHEDEG